MMFKKVCREFPLQPTHIDTDHSQIWLRIAQHPSTMRFINSSVNIFVFLFNLHGGQEYPDLIEFMYSWLRLINWTLDEAGHLDTFIWISGPMPYVPLFSGTYFCR